MSAHTPRLETDQRSREIFRQIVDGYLATGEPVGSRNIARLLPMSLSPATVRNVMTDLELAGLIYAPHTSAGRLPTERGLRFFVDAMMEVGNLTAEERARIEAQMKAAATGRTLDGTLTEADYGATEGWLSVNVSPNLRPSDVSFTILPTLAFFEFIPLKRQSTQINEICSSSGGGGGGGGAALAAYDEGAPVGLTDEVVMTTA